MTQDDFWRRPAGEPAGAAPRSAPQAGPRPVPYAGPPQSTPPPPGWRPRTVAELPPARELPAQDHGALDAEEKIGRTLTFGVGLVAGAVVLILLIVLCTRLLF